jgi:hypothetical protein
MVMDTHGALPGQVQPGGCAQQRVSHELLDVSFSCAEHAETTLAARGPAQLHCLDDEMYVAGQIDDSATTISEIQVLASRAAARLWRAALRVQCRGDDHRRPSLPALRPTQL